MKIKNVSIIYLILALVGIWFLARFWLPPGITLAGHDSGLAIDAKGFLQSRLYAWDPQGFGKDNSAHFGSLLMHSLDYIFAVLSGVPYAGNSLLLFFWISVIFLSAFVFSYSLKDKLGHVFVFLFPVFLTFNFYILQSIFILERAKYSLLAASLLFLTIVLKFQERKLSLLTAGILSSLTLFFFNSGSWLGVPLYGGFFVLVLGLLIVEALKGIKRRKFTEFFRLSGFLALTGLGFLILNSYSIIPYAVTFLEQDIFSVTNRAVIAQNKAWLENLSQAVSFSNIFRLQGVPDWYASSIDINFSHSYAKDYLSNPYLVVASFLFPVVTLFSFILAKTREQKRLIALLGVIALLAMFFMAGSHRPLGFIYEFFYETVPGFSIFRSPYFKFGSVFFLSVSVLMAFAISRTIENISNKLRGKNKTFVKIFLPLFTIMLWLGYYNVFFMPEKIFSWQRNLSTKFEVPEYVYSFGEWTKEASLGDSRILLVPPINESWENDAYTWGYWSLTNLPSTLSSQAVVTNENLPKRQKVWVNRLYYLIKEDREEEVLDLSLKLGIDYLLLREDILSDASWSAASSPKEFEKILRNFDNLQKVETFGKWVIYKFDREPSLKFSVISSLTAIPEGHFYLAQEFLKDENSVFDKSGQISQFLSRELNVYGCQSCPLEKKDALSSLPKVNILPNSPLYFLKEMREENTLRVAETEQAKIDAYLGFSVRRSAEVKTMLDFGFDERYSADALKTMNLYLGELYKLLESSTELDKYLFRARRLTDNINIVDASLKDYVTRDDFGKRSEKFRQEILDVLWNIKQLKSLFPIINDKNRLETEKVYYIDLPEEGDYELYLDSSTLPINNVGQVIFPTDISYRVQDKTIRIPLEKGVDKWHKFQIPTDLKSGELTLKFPKFSNLLEIVETSIEYSPTLERACYIGKIANFNPNKIYRVEVKTSRKDQTLRLFLKDAEIQSGTNKFIGGQDIVDIGQTSISQPFYHLYYPSIGAVDPTIYLCSDNRELPVIDSIEFHEVASPNIVSTKLFRGGQMSFPEISYKKLNPTHYQVSIENAKDPFILIFNESYNPFWHLSGFDAEHFMIDGYANAWVVDKKGNFDLDLEYFPQKLFHRGLLVSAAGLVSAGGLLVYYFKKKKEK